MDTDRLAETHFASVDPQFYDDTQDLIDAELEERASEFQFYLFNKLEEIIEEELQEADEDVFEEFMKNENYQYIVDDLQQKFEEYK